MIDQLVDATQKVATQKVAAQFLSIPGLYYWTVAQPKAQI